MVYRNTILIVKADIMRRYEGMLLIYLKLQKIMKWLKLTHQLL